MSFRVLAQLLTRSTYALCQGERGADRTSQMPMSRTCFLEVVAEDRIAVAQQGAGKFGKGKGLPQLLDYPFRGWVGGHIEMQNAASVMGQNEKHVKNLET